MLPILSWDRLYCISTFLQMWANGIGEGSIMALLAEGLNSIGRSDMAEELEELNPLL